MPINQLTSQEDCIKLETFLCLKNWVFGSIQFRSLWETSAAVDLVHVRKRMRFQPQVQVVYLVRMLFSCVRIFKTITNTTTLHCITASDTARRLISYVQCDQKPIFSTFYRFFASKIIFINKILSCLFLLCIVYQLYVSICHFKPLLKNKQMPCAQLICLILGKNTNSFVHS